MSILPHQVFVYTQLQLGLLFIHLNYIHTLKQYTRLTASQCTRILTNTNLTLNLPGEMSLLQTLVLILWLVHALLTLCVQNTCQSLFKDKSMPEKELYITHHRPLLLTKTYIQTLTACIAQRYYLISGYIVVNITTLVAYWAIVLLFQRNIVGIVNYVVF